MTSLKASAAENFEIDRDNLSLAVVMKDRSKDTKDGLVSLDSPRKTTSSNNVDTTTPDRKRNGGHIPGSTEKKMKTRKDVEGQKITRRSAPPVLDLDNSGSQDGVQLPDTPESDCSDDQGDDQALAHRPKRNIAPKNVVSINVKYKLIIARVSN